MAPNEPIHEEPLAPRRAAAIVGASTGFGAALARKLASEGYDLGLLSRNLEQLEALAQEIEAAHPVRAFPYRHDVLERDQAPRLLQQVARDLGRLDLFIYNAGIMFSQDPEDYDAERDLRTIEVNTLGAVAWLAPVAHRFAQAGAGHIVAVGSIAGERGRRALPGYSASKAALHTYVEGLRNRVSRMGVTVTTLKPGQMQTTMLQNAAAIRGPIPVARAADLAWRAIERGAQNSFIPGRWALIAFALRHIPSFIFRRMNL